MNGAVIFAGGSGMRMNHGGLPKQFLEFEGKPIIVYTLELFENHPDIDSIVVACLKDWIPYLQELIIKFNLKKVHKIVAGGATAQDSIREGLEALTKLIPEDSVVLIHDGVRPLINRKTISDNIESVNKFGSCITSVAAKETFIISDQKDGNLSIPNRKDCKVARAPQSFYLKDIIEAHRRALIEGKHEFIDCCTMMNHYGHHLHTIEGPEENIKITTPTDYFLFKALIKIRENNQIYGM